MFPGVIFSYNVSLGKCTWIDTNTILGHHLKVDDFTTIYSSVLINGNCIMKEYEIGKN